MKSFVSNSFLTVSYFFVTHKNGLLIWFETNVKITAAPRERERQFITYVWSTYTFEKKGLLRQYMLHFITCIIYTQLICN